MSARIEGFIVWDYKNRFEIAIRQLSRWNQEKKIIYKEHVLQGLENAPQALKMVMAGQNFGKMIVRVLHEQPHL
jgi:NADPH-dependent curcumin reductase CurA